MTLGDIKKVNDILAEVNRLERDLYYPVKFGQPRRVKDGLSTEEIIYLKNRISNLEKQLPEHDT